MQIRITGLTAAAAAHILRVSNVGKSVAISAVADELDGIDPASDIPSMYAIAASAADECGDADEPGMPTCCRPCVESEALMRLGWGRTRMALRTAVTCPSPYYLPESQPRFELTISADPDDLTRDEFAAHPRCTAACAAAEELSRSNPGLRVLK